MQGSAIRLEDINYNMNQKQTKLASLRRYHNITQKQMAEIINVDLRTYINKEKGRSQFKLSEMFIISKRLNKTIEEIFLPPDFM